jgi:hypothetical protein
MTSVVATPGVVVDDRSKVTRWPRPPSAKTAPAPRRYQRRNSPRHRSARFALPPERRIGALPGVLPVRLPSHHPSLKLECKRSSRDPDDRRPRASSPAKRCSLVVSPRGDGRSGTQTASRRRRPRPRPSRPSGRCRGPIQLARVFACVVPPVRPAFRATPDCSALHCVVRSSVGSSCVRRSVRRVFVGRFVVSSW